MLGIVSPVIVIGDILQRKTSSMPCGTYRRRVAGLGLLAYIFWWAKVVILPEKNAYCG